jgi:hypothetical protein
MDIAPRIPQAQQSADGKQLSNRKKRRDPGAPKRASNAYMIFCKERRAQLKNENPEMPFGQLGKRLGDLWRTMTAEEKRPYEDLASGDRDRYKGEMNQYQSNVMMKQVNAATGGSGSVSQSQSRSQEDGEEENRETERENEEDQSNHEPGIQDHKKLKLTVAESQAQEAVEEQATAETHTNEESLTQAN